MGRFTRRRVLGGVGAGIGTGLLAAPWPVVDTPLAEAPFFRETLERIDRRPVSRGNGLFRVGVAEADLTPPRPVPVAGFLDQIWQPYVGVNSRCMARALTVACGPVAVTILTADLLLVDAPLARRVLARAGLARDEVYFTASHTHSGPGGWGLHPLERLVAGTYDPEVADELAGTLARVVVESRARLRPAEVGFVREVVPGLQSNRLIPGGATNDACSAWVFREATPGGTPAVLATLAVFGAHATIAHPHPARLGGDYPAAFAEALRARGKSGVVMFAAGTVGDAAPVKPPAPNHQQAARAFGEELAARVAGTLDAAEFRREIDLANFGVAADLPPVQVPYRSARWRVSPLATWWVGRPRAWLHALRIGPAVLVGFPGDVTGQLAAGLAPPYPVVATSFNGDYKGYLVTADTFRTYPHYETRVMNFFGPHAGDALVAMARRMIDRVMGPPAAPPRDR